MIEIIGWTILVGLAIVGLVTIFLAILVIQMGKQDEKIIVYELSDGKRVLFKKQRTDYLD